MPSNERYRILAIDYGSKRIGIALSDELRMLASPRGVIPNDAKALGSILALAQAQNVRMVLIGIPKTLKNTDSEMTSEVLKFRDRLERMLGAVGITLIGRDERLTSVMANFNISQRGLPKGKREEKSLRDEEAARIVLQEYLDTNR